MATTPAELEKLGADIVGLAAAVRVKLAAAAVDDMGEPPAKHPFANTGTGPDGRPACTCGLPEANPVHLAKRQSAAHYLAQHRAAAEAIQKAEGGTIEQARALAWGRNPKLMRAYNEAPSKVSSP